MKYKKLRFNIISAFILTSLITSLFTLTSCKNGKVNGDPLNVINGESESGYETLSETATEEITSVFITEALTTEESTTEPTTASKRTVSTTATTKRTGEETLIHLPIQTTTEKVIPVPITDPDTTFTTAVEENGVSTTSDNSTVDEPTSGQILLEIDEIRETYPITFSACLPWPSPRKYEVRYEGSENFNYKSGDIVNVTYKDMHGDEGDRYYTMTATEVEKSDFHLDPTVAYKPVIYLYPEKKTDVKVSLDYNGKLTYTIPEYKNGWNVTAYPDGKIVNKEDNKTYPYLFWEGTSDTQYDLNEGFCVKGSDADKFLDEKLKQIGLTEKETNDFKEFWEPILRVNKYNRICFQTKAYTDSAKLSITPAPDTLIRVFIVYTPLKEPINIKAQKLPKYDRKGFTAVEWGGAAVLN